MTVVSAHDTLPRTGAKRSGAPGTSRRAPIAFRALVTLVVLVAVPANALAGVNDSPKPGRANASPAPNAVIWRTTVEPVWPAPDRLPGLTKIGEHVAVVFSPDFSVPTNHVFYERMGFLYLEDASWERVLDAIARHNAESPERAIETVFVTTHGANGNGLKLQVNESPSAPRSYVSMGALQERLGAAGVRRCVLAACNTSRLFRPEIYNTLDRTTRDPLFLPPTLGIVDASPDFDPSTSKVAIVRRADNLKENTSEGNVAELSPAARRALGFDDVRASRAVRFVISDLFVQMLTADPKLLVTSGGYVTEITLERPDNERSDRFYSRFVKLLDQVATRTGSA